ncbi:MAG: UDP-3-O-(3-hydroxymyristoyl)glucosamine N-acyltransferase [Marinilabiliaceae bacterium]|jgi:UDP-3-O-[3-hydroxymyristoyl] glucosamine N-acyltransferase|nr:UDP-3-O-(3-hydroxymyristoyl)glucosamine N-acyltransferase [Marinilabiliaceae bacterium]
MKFTAKAIAEYLKGEIIGNPEAEVYTVAKIEEGEPGAISFLSNMNYEKYIYDTKSSIVLVNNDFVPSSGVAATMIRVPNAYEAFASLLVLYEQAKPKKKGIHPTAVVEESAEIGSDVYIGALAYVGENVKLGKGAKVYPHVYIGDNTQIGEECTFYSGVKIYHECIIGNGCIIHSGSVVGSDGFGFAPSGSDDYRKIPQIGNVVLEDRVEIGANTVVDRATMGSTIVRKGVKLDNLVQLAHNVEVGENTVMAAQCGVAGSTKIGKNCMFGGQVGITGHVSIADGTKAAAQTGISGPVKNPGTVLYGSPAFDYKSFQKSYIVFRKLPDLKEKVDILSQQMNLLKES